MGKTDNPECVGESCARALPEHVGPPVLIDPYGYMHTPVDIAHGKSIVLPMRLPALGKGAPVFMPDLSPGATMLEYVFEAHDPKHPERYRLTSVRWVGAPR